MFIIIININSTLGLLVGDTMLDVKTIVKLNMHLCVITLKICFLFLSLFAKRDSCIAEKREAGRSEGR